MPVAGLEGRPRRWCRATAAGCPAPARRVRQRHRVAGRVRRRDQLLRAGLPVGLLGARGPRDVVRAEPGGLEGDRAGALHQRAFPVGRSRCGWWPWASPSVGATVDRAWSAGALHRALPDRDNRQVTTSADGQPAHTFYDAIGGYPTIAKIVDRFYAGRRHRRGAAAAVPGGGPRPGPGAVHAVPGAVLGRPHDVLRDARPPPAADAARAVRGDPARQGALAAALPRRARRGRPVPRARRAVLGLRHARRPVHGEHASRRPRLRRAPRAPPRSRARARPR